MKFNLDYLKQYYISKHFFRLYAVIIPTAISIGLIVAFFLSLLDWATVTRLNNLWLLFFLPLAGVLIYWLYARFGEKLHAGNNLIIDEIHKPTKGVSAKITPLIFVTTIITHLFGGSAGREGTAVQMGGGVTSLFIKWFKIRQEDISILFMCGMSAGFGAVFGTPFAGAVFALEVLTRGKINYRAILPCLLASVVADLSCTLTGITHTEYSIKVIDTGLILYSTLHFNVILIVNVLLAGIIFGFAAYLFISFSHYIKQTSNEFISVKCLIPVIGSVLILGISSILGTFDYIGLGVEAATPNGISIVNAFSSQNISYLSWFWKLLLTSITLGMGFKGGEVTPLFFIGATLGNTIGILSGNPIDLFAGLGFIAVFAAATNTPVASAIMGIELFGPEYSIYFVVICLMAYYFSGRKSIYASQR